MLYVVDMKEKERAREKEKAVDGCYEEECQDVEPQRPLKRLRDQEVLQPHLRRNTEFCERLSSFTMKLDSRKLRLEEEKAEEARKETEKAREAARRKVKELEAREEAFELLIKKEFSERRKLEELLKELRKEIEAEKAGKESVEAKVRELGGRREELEALGGCLEMKAIQVREGEEELEKERKEFYELFQSKESKYEERLAEFRKKQAEFEKAQEAREEAFEGMVKKEISNRRKLEGLVEELKREIEVEKEEKESVEAKLKELGERGEELEALRGCLEMKAIQVREGEEELEKKRKEFDERLEEFRQKQAELEVHAIKLDVKVREIDQKDLKLDMRLAELNKKEKEIDERENHCKQVECIVEQKQAEFEVHVLELNAKEREFDEKVKHRDPEMNTRPISYELMEKKLQDQFNILNKRIDDMELKRVNDLESKKAEMTSEEILVDDTRPEKSLDHSSEESIRRCVNTSGKDIEMIEQQVEITTGETAMNAKNPDKSSDHSPEANIRGCVITSGKDLQIVLNEHFNDYNSVKDEVVSALKLSSDPAKLVLDAMEGFYPPHLKKGGVEFKEGVVRKNCIMLLEWLTKTSLHIRPTVRTQAIKLASDWKSRMKSDAEHSLEVLAFLELLAAFELASFYQSELEVLLRIIAHYSQAPLLLRELDFVVKMRTVIKRKLRRGNQAEAARLISAFELGAEFPTVILPKNNRALYSGPAQLPDRSNVSASQMEDSSLPAQQHERSSNDQGCTNPRPRILSFAPQCLKGCTTDHPKLVERICTNKLHCIVMSDALRLASDPAELVLGVVKNPSSLSLKKGCRSVCLASPEHGPLLLLNYLWRMPPHVKPNVRSEALSYAKDWRSKLAEEMDEGIEGVCFLLFLAAYKLESCFDKDELFSVFGRGQWCRSAVKLSRLLGLKNFIPSRQFIGYLVRSKNPLDALWCIEYANMFGNDHSARARLSTYLATPLWMRREPQLRYLIDELVVWQDVVNHNLADETCKAYIFDLQKRKQNLELENAATGPASSSTLASPLPKTGCPLKIKLVKRK